MFELMMAAQADAAKEKKVEVEEKKEKTTKSFGSGFKKGFLGSGGGGNALLFSITLYCFIYIIIHMCV